MQGQPAQRGMLQRRKEQIIYGNNSSETHKDQSEFEKTPEFKQKMKMRKRIEPLNAHLKNDLGMKQNICKHSLKYTL